MSRQPLGFDAYGMVGQVFAVATRTGSATVAGPAEHVRAFGDGLRASSDDYRRTDVDTATGCGCVR